MNREHILPFIDPVNEELTAAARKNEVIIRYKNWLIENGCTFPSLDFPVAFGEYGIIGTAALEDLPTLKAFLFVPIELIITPQKVRTSEIGIVTERFPKIFKTHSRSADYTLWIYVLFERLKGEHSFYYPYFSAIGNCEMLMDWTSDEKAELQDKFLVFECKKHEKTALFYFESLSEVFEMFPEFFPQNELEKNFLWAYKMVTTRSFSHGEGMVIPLADNLNHDDVYVDYLTLSKEFLLRKSEESDELKDYKDFLGIPHRSEHRKKFRTHLNKLEKLIDRMPDVDFDPVRHIWQVDELLSGYESSSDEEEFINDEDESEDNEESGENEDSEESESDEQVQEDPVEKVIEGKYFVMRTGSEGSFYKGSQVFNCYGRLNNTDLLNEYGFSLLPNRYDSLYVRVGVNQMVKSKNVNGSIVVPKIEITNGGRLNDFIEIYYLKYFKLNEKFLEYFRKILIHKPADRFSVSAELKVVTQATQVLLQVQSCFPTSLEEDEQMISEKGKPIRKLFALRYRISMKRILKSQVDLMNKMRDILFDLMLGKSLEEAHLSDKSFRGIREVYPLRNYLKNLRLFKSS